MSGQPIMIQQVVTDRRFLKGGQSRTILPHCGLGRVQNRFLYPTTQTVRQKG